MMCRLFVALNMHINRGAVRNKTRPRRSGVFAPKPATSQENTSTSYRQSGLFRWDADPSGDHRYNNPSIDSESSRQ